MNEITIQNSMLLIGDLERKEVQVSILINSAYYFLNCVVIILEQGYYRLIAVKRGVVLTDKDYKTARGARIAFSKMFKPHAKEKGAQWGVFYRPDPDWFGNNGLRLMKNEEKGQEYVVTVI